MSQITSPQRLKISVRAACDCGQVETQIEGAIYAMFFCACTHCQKYTGAGHSALAVTRKTSVTVKGRTNTKAHKADSGAETTRYFCADCGTTMFGETSGNENIRLINAGQCSDSSWFVPTHVIFARSRQNWDNFGDLPMHHTYPEE